MTYARKLSDTEVRAIRADYCANNPRASLRALARRYQVSRQTILHAVHFLTYKRLQGECNGRAPPKPAPVFERDAPDRLGGGCPAAAALARRLTLAR